MYRNPPIARESSNTTDADNVPFAIPVPQQPPVDLFGVAARRRIVLSRPEPIPEAFQVPPTMVEPTVCDKIRESFEDAFACCLGENRHNRPRNRC